MKAIFVTGAGGLLGRHLLPRLLAARSDLTAYVLVRDRERWGEVAARLGRGAERVHPVGGDVREPGLGLDASTRRKIARAVGAVVHLAADTVFSRPLQEARETNVAGTRHLLDLIASWPAALCYVSTAFVAGRRTGSVPEEAEPGSAGWVNGYEQSKWEAEQLVRGSGRHWAIARSSTVVCDSVAGGVSQFNAVHRALRLFHHGLAPMIPGGRDSTVDLVPADYVASGIAALVLNERWFGETFHLCAGRGALPLGEMLATTHAFWSRDAGWRRRGILEPTLCDLSTYRLFERSVEEAADERLKQVVRSLSHFVPQLALPKRFETGRAESLVGAAPKVRSYWAAVLAHVTGTGWGRLPIPRAA